MTIIRTMLAATPGDVDLAAETASVRAAIARAEAALDHGMPVTMTSNWNTASPMGRLTIQYEGSAGHDLPLPLVIAFDMEGSESPTANHWMDGDGREALVIAKESLDVPAPGRPHGDPDFADLVATGLAWSLIDAHGATAATIDRATPWSPARILLGTQDRTVRAASGATRPGMTWRERTDPRGGADALAAMRPGTLVRPRDATLRLEPIRIRLSPRVADPVARMRALAAWAAFRDSRP